MSILIYCLSGKLGPSFRNCQHEEDKTLHTTKSVQEVTVVAGMASCSQQPVDIWKVIWTFQFFAILYSGYNFRFWGRIQKLLRHWSNSTSQTLTLRPQKSLEVVHFNFWCLYLGQTIRPCQVPGPSLHQSRIGGGSSACEPGREGTLAGRGHHSLPFPPLATSGKVRVLTSSSFETKVREMFGTVNFEEDNWRSCIHPRIQDKKLPQKPLDVLAVSRLWCAHFKHLLLWPHWRKQYFAGLEVKCWWKTCWKVLKELYLS